MQPSEFIGKYIKKISRRTKITFFSTIIIGIAAHFFALVNTLNNYDNIRFNPTGIGVGVTSGRWLLSLINDKWHKFWGVYNVPFFNGGITLLFIAITACMIVKIFDIKNTLNCILIGGIIIVFPPITSLMFFMFTAPYYALAICLSVLAVFLCCISGCGWIISILCIACSIGIYQAYLPITAGLYVLLLIYQCICKEWGIKETFFKGIQYLMILIAGLMTYYGLLKFFLNYYQMDLASYQGIDSMGQLDIAHIPYLILDILKNCFELSARNYCSINQSWPVRIFILGLMLSVILFFVTIICDRTYKVQNIFCIICLSIILLIASDSIEIMCPNGFIYTLMVYGMVLLFIAPVIYMESIEKKSNNGKAHLLYLGEWIATISLIVIISNYIWQSNGNYMSSYYTQEQTISYFQTLVTRIKSVNGYSEKLPVVFIGDYYEDESFKNLWSETPFWYGGISDGLINRYSADYFMKNYLGYNYKTISEENKKKIEEKTKNMPEYPKDGSIQIIDNVIVVKRKYIKQ